ncbi:hypothetical protein O7606_20710 [Micromonospora sp. WMMD882]|uniref:HNH endonuclease n=1 Tax=Micromonospora sp. WMMD882 TaxID=3015151 RepID=UPI00248C4020|nr:hypothetical protein [Micromonospora sp. WMMD882]WBB78615.1 hypothetical protein O7606_20710 [Micromonospora sp. WMMD882]
MPELSPVERLALYQVWGRRCVWCKKPVSFGAFEVEHLVPKSLQGPDLERTLAQYGLDPAFDVYGLSNLAPSCRPCNGFKGNRPVRGAPIVVATLDHAAKQAPKVKRRASRLCRSSQLSEAFAVIEALGPGASEKERKALSDFSERLEEILRAAKTTRPLIEIGCGVIDAPLLKRSKKRFKHTGYSDTEQMLYLMRDWAQDNTRLLREIVSDTLDTSDVRTRRAWPERVDFLAYAKEMGDFLAEVTFDVDYLYVTDDHSAMAQVYHRVELWVTLDPRQKAVVNVVPDHLGTLGGCPGYPEPNSQY